MNVATIENGNRSRIHPLKFALYISMASITMMFAGLLSAYIVRQASGNWFEFGLPAYFTISTFTILLSSLTGYGSLVFFKKGNEVVYRNLLILTLFLGLAFVVLQYQGWLALQEIGIDLKGNPSGAFVYVISGLHVAHVIGGIAILSVAVMHALSLPFKPTSKRIVRLELTTQYWHYVDLLWVVLYLFLMFYR